MAQIATPEQAQTVVAQIVGMITDNIAPILVLLVGMLAIKVVSGMFTDAANGNGLIISTDPMDAKMAKIRRDNQRVIAASDRASRENDRIMRGL